jgi:hypothetical protein
MPHNFTSEHRGVVVANNRTRLIATVLFSVITLLSGCADDMNTLPVATIAAIDGQSVSEALKENGPTIVHIGRPQVEAGSGERFLTWFVLVNPLNVPISYHGYRMDSWTERPPVGEISPFYGMQTKNPDEGQWQNGNVGWCGTGAGTMVVKGEHCGRFKTYLPLGESDCKIGFTCSWTNNGKTTSKVIWSPTISTN